MNEQDENLNENFINQRNENQNEQNGEMYLNNEYEEDILVDQPLFDKISSRDLLEMINDTIPSIFFILFLFLPFYFYPKYCDLNMYLSMKTLIGIYSFFIGRALIKLGIIHFNRKNVLGYRIFLLIFYCFKCKLALYMYMYMHNN